MFTNIQRNALLRLGRASITVSAITIKVVTPIPPIYLLVREKIGSG